MMSDTLGLFLTYAPLTGPTDWFNPPQEIHCKHNHLIKFLAGFWPFGPTVLSCSWARIWHERGV